MFAFVPVEVSTGFGIVPVPTPAPCSELLLPQADNVVTAANNSANGATDADLDVAAALIKVLEDPSWIGRTVECCGPQVMALSEIVRLAGRLAGHERPQIPLPAWLARIQAFAFECLPGQPLMSRDNLDSMRVPSVAGGRLQGLKDLGITPSSIGSVAPAYLAPGQGVARLDAWRSTHR